MNEYNPIETIDKTNLTNQTKFRLDKISKTENYFIEEINQGKSCSKKLNKYVACCFWLYWPSLHCFECNKWWNIKYFIYKYFWFTSWNSKCKPYITLLFSLTTGIVKKLLNITRKQKEKAWYNSYVG